jgi:nucleoside-diphosphate-sugar epimerase
MKILLAGSNSYIATRLIPYLLDKGHEVICVARDKKYFLAHNRYRGMHVLNGDLLRSHSIEPFPKDIDAAYYLANRLTQTSGFAGLEALSAQNFMDALNKTH